MIIVIAATGITGLLVPKLNAPIIYWRLILLMLASTFGLFGLTIGLAVLLISMLNLTSLGVEQISITGRFRFQENKDVLIRGALVEDEYPSGKAHKKQGAPKRGGISMVKRAFCLILCVMVALTMGGCWNYRSLGEMALVMGFAIDFDEQTGNYLVTYEVLHLAPAEIASAEQSELVEGEGKTIFDAARNAKRRLQDKLYFGSASVLIVSQQIVDQGGLLGVLGWFLSDAECRETLCLVVAQTHKASEILKANEEGESIVSNVIHDIITEDSQTTSSSPHILLYQAFNTLKAQGIALTLPAVHTVVSGDQIIPEINGTAVFQGQKFVGYISPEETKYFLLAIDKVQGGILTVSPTGEKKDSISLEISSSNGAITFTEEQSRPVFRMETVTKVFIGEKGRKDTKYEEEEIKQIEALAGEMVKTNIEKVIEKAQKEFDSDIFGFGNKIYKYDLKLWERLSENWQELFPEIKVKVKSKVHVLNTAFIK